MQINFSESLLGIANYKMEAVASENVTTSFFKTGETKVELLEATGENSPIAKFIEKRAGDTSYCI